MSFVIGGTITRDKNSLTIGSGFTLYVKTSLSCVQGSTDANNGQFNPLPSTAKGGPGYIQLLDPLSTTTNAVCIDFTKTISAGNDPNSDITYTVDADATAKGDPLYDLLIGTTCGQPIQTHLAQSAGLRFYLAAIQNPAPPKTLADVQVLQPMSFAFTTVPDNIATSSVGSLSMWISVKGGKTDPDDKGGSTSGLQFATSLTGGALSPVPKGSSASVIFSHHVMFNLFLKVSPSCCLQK